MRSPSEPDAHRCADCGQVCLWRAIVTVSDTADGIYRFDPLWEREECLCEMARREQREAAAARERHLAQIQAAERRRERRLAASGLYGLLLTRTFEGFDAALSPSGDPCTPSQQIAYEKCRAWADDFERDRTRTGFCLSGSRKGCGKTHLMVAAGLRVVERDAGSIWFVNLGDWLDAQRAEIGRKQDVGAAMERAINVDLLLIDDFGTEKIRSDEAGDWTRERLYMLFDKRLNWGRPVLMTTNTGVEGIAAHIGGDDPERIVSRLLGMCRWASVDGPDGR